jgi:hypothetical protein
MDLTCPNCGKPGLIPINGMVLMNSFEIAEKFPRKTALRIIINSWGLEDPEHKIYLVCRYCGYIKEVDCSIRKFLKKGE